MLFTHWHEAKRDPVCTFFSKMRKAIFKKMSRKVNTASLEVSHTLTAKLPFNCAMLETQFWSCEPAMHPENTPTSTRWTFYVFSVCDSQSDWGLITATLLLLIPSDPLPACRLIRFLCLGYLSSPALTVSDAWLMGLAFKSAALMRQNPNKGCHTMAAAAVVWRK